MKYFYIISAVLISLTSTAIAAQGWTQVEDGLTVVDPLGMTVDELDKILIHARDGTRVGELDNVVRKLSDDEIAVLIDVGEFVGVDKKEVLIPAEKLSAHADGITLDMTKEELKALPEHSE